ncbi:MAG: hypothetical protein ATN33_05015 [Epulopiscium sp. Nele67-Bin001]|nr:MAG: hypothetical protein ATN33_05015 [Epulopiscium sp. Nele67-Bin001]
MMWSRLLCITWGLSSGMVISTGMASFITAMGIIPRLLTKSNIETHCVAATNAAILGTIFGNIIVLFHPYIPLPSFVIGIFGLCIGIFTGCLAAAVTEIVNVFPVMGRRLHIYLGMRLFVFSFAMGKLVGALYYWLYPGFINI